MVVKVFGTFFGTSRGIVNVNCIDFIRREGNSILIWVTGKDTACLTLEGEEAENFMKMLEALP